MTKRSDIKRITEKIFDLLQDVEVGVALQALARVTEEFRRAQEMNRNEPKNLGISVHFPWYFKSLMVINPHL